MLTPALMPIACLIVSTLSNSITTSTWTPCCLSARSMALRMARSLLEGHEALAREVGGRAQAPARQAMAGMRHQHHGLRSQREHLEGARRRRIGQDAEVRLVVEHRLHHLVGVQALEEHPRLRVRGHERLHVAAHVVQAHRVDRGHPHGALHPLAGGGEVGAGLVEALEQVAARVEEGLALLGGRERPPRPVEQRGVELALELPDGLARRRLGDAAGGGGAGEAAEPHDVAVEPQRLQVHEAIYIISHANEMNFHFALG